MVDLALKPRRAIRAGLGIGWAGIALAVAMLALGGCGRSSDDAPREVRSKSAHETPSPRAPAPPTVVAHRLGSPRIEPGGQLLPARPCETLGRKGTTTIPIFPEVGNCARVAPGERLRFVNDTGIGSRHATAVRIRLGNYELSIPPGRSGLIPAPVESYLGRGSHPVRAAGTPGATILLLPTDCVMRPPVRSGQELCFHQAEGADLGVAGRRSSG